MSRTLTRPCLGCGRAVRGKPRCGRCSTTHERAKRARRPDLDDHHERQRRRRLVADHVVEVAIGGLATGPLRVLCRQENSRRSARVLSTYLPIHPSPAEPTITHLDDGPVVA
jgi:hypothetical protein